MASVPPDLLDPALLRAPLRTSNTELTLDDLTILTAMPAFGALDSDLILPAASPEGFFSLLDQWNQATLNGATSPDKLYEVLSLVSGEFAKLTSISYREVAALVASFPEKFDGTDISKLMRIEEAISRLNYEAKALVLPIFKGKLARATAEALRQLQTFKAEAFQATFVGNEKLKAQILEQVSHDLRSGTAKFLRAAPDQAVMLTKMAARFKWTGRVLAVVPIATGLLDLYRARNDPALYARTMQRLQLEAKKAAIEGVIGFGIGKGVAAVLASKTLMPAIVIAFAPTSIGFVVVGAVTIGVGAAGIYVTNSLSEALFKPDTVLDRTLP